MNHLTRQQEYWTEFLTRDEYRRFGNYLVDKGLTIGHTIEKLDDTFKVVIKENSLTNWEEILKDIRVD